MITEAEYEVLRAQQQAKTGKRKEKFAEVGAMPFVSICTKCKLEHTACLCSFKNAGEAGRCTKRLTAAKDKPKRKGELLSIAIFLPIRLISEANNRDHWTDKSKRHAKQKQELKVEWYRLTRNAVVEFPCVVKFTRIGQKAFDSDAVVIGCKWIRDAVCECLGVDDGDTERIRFEYDQEATGKREYGVRIEVRKV